MKRAFPFAVILAGFALAISMFISNFTGYTYPENKSVLDGKFIFGTILNFDDNYFTIEGGSQKDLDAGNIIRDGFNYFHHNDDKFMAEFNKLYDMAGNTSSYVIIDNRVFTVVEVTQANTKESQKATEDEFAIGTILDENGNDIFKWQKFTPYIYLITCNGDSPEYNRYVAKLEYYK